MGGLPQKVLLELLGNRLIIVPEIFGQFSICSAFKFIVHIFVMTEN